MIIFMLKCLKKVIKYSSTFKIKNLSTHHSFLYAGTESMLEKMNVCKNNPENLSKNK